VVKQNGIQGTGNVTLDLLATLDLSYAADTSSAGTLNVNSCSWLNLAS